MKLLLKGISASSGKIEGKVKIVHGAEDTANFQKALSIYVLKKAENGNKALFEAAWDQQVSTN